MPPTCVATLAISPRIPSFPRGMTPITYLDYMARLFGLPAQVRKPRLASLIRAVDLLSASGDPISGFSTGMTRSSRRGGQPDQ